jgi:hypothetical protein
MKKITLFIITIAMAPTFTVFGQAKKPSIMILPSDPWCNLKGYITEIDNQGTKEKISDYKRVFQEDIELVAVLAKLEGIMTDRGNAPLNAESAIKNLANDDAEDNLRTSKAGASIAETPIEKLKKKAKADIIVYLTYSINVTGPKKQVTFTLSGRDSYTNKPVATASGTGSPSLSAEVPVLLEEAVLSHMDAFMSQLQNYYDEMFKMGREVAFDFKKFDSWDGNYTDEIAGKQIGEYINDWFQENSFERRWTPGDFEDGYMTFTSVRIPVIDANGVAIDARAFIRPLQKKLEGPPFNLKGQLYPKGLGKAVLYMSGQNK